MPPLHHARSTCARLPLAALACLALTACGKSRDFNAPWAGGLPLAADANGDGVEDLIGERGGLVVLDGRTYKPLWHREDVPLLRHGAYRHLTIAGTTLAVASDRSLLLLELASGQTLATVPLSDKISSMCAAGAAVWLRLIDEQQGLVELAAGAPAARFDPTAAAPAACTTPAPHHHYACDHAGARCASEPSTSIMQLRDATTTPPTEMSVELKSPGTPELTLVLPGGQRVLYDREGQRLDAVDLAGGRLFLKHRGAVTAVDPATGSPLWAVPCGGNTPFLRATATRVYVECSGPRQYLALRVLDHNGVVLTDLGAPRY